jgi:hypothetical protein
VNQSKNYYFLSDDEVSFFDSFSTFIIPTGKDPLAEPGAHEVGTVSYVDSILSEFPNEVQAHFRQSVQNVLAESRKKFMREFGLLNDIEKEQLLRSLHENHETRQLIFELRSLALEGFYSDYHDPSYDGLSAWKLINFGGKRISDLKKDWSFVRAWRDAVSSKGSAKESGL